MIVEFKDLEKVDERDKAIGIPFKHKGRVKMFWCPKSLVENIKWWKEHKFIDVPDWFYDKKVTELFL